MTADTPAADDSCLLFLTAQVLLASREVASFVCASRGARDAVSDAARSAVQAEVGDVVLPPGERWAAHAALLASIGSEGRQDLLRPLSAALYAAGAGILEEADGLVEALTAKAPGPVAMIPVRRRLLRRLCFDFGALGRAPGFARLTTRSAQGTAWEEDAAQDLLHVLTLCSDATLCLGLAGAPPSTAELAEAICARPYPESAKAQRLLGRALATCAESWLLNALQPGEAAILRMHWSDAESALREALDAHRRALGLATAALRAACGLAGARGSFEVPEQRPAEEVAPVDHPVLFAETPPDILALVSVAGDGPRRAAWELGRCVAAVAEFWHSIAYVSGQRLADNEGSTVFGVEGEVAANAALDAFEDAVRVMRAAGSEIAQAEASEDFADVLLGYGNVLLCFFEQADAREVERPLEQALKLYEELLGHGHPRTCQVRRLCRHV